MPSPSFRVYRDPPIPTGQSPISNPRVENYDFFHSYVPDLSIEDVNELEDLLVYGQEQVQLQLQNLLGLDLDVDHLNSHSRDSDPGEEKHTADGVDEVKALVERLSVAFQGETEVGKEQAYTTFREKVSGLLQKKKLNVRTPSRMPIDARVPLAELPIVKIKSGKSALGRSTMSSVAVDGEPVANADSGPALRMSNSRLHPESSRPMKAMQETHFNSRFQTPPRADLATRMRNQPGFPHTPRHKNSAIMDTPTSINTTLISGLSSGSPRSTSSWACSFCGSICRWCNTRISQSFTSTTSPNSIHSNSSRISKPSSRASSRQMHSTYHSPSSQSSKTRRVHSQLSLDKNVQVMEDLAAKGRKLRDILPALTAMDESSKGIGSLYSLSGRKEKTEVEKWLEVEMAK